MADAALHTTETPAVDDRRSLKRKLARALMRQKMRALMLVAPLLLFVLLTFVLPIADMLFRSVENDIVGETLPRTVAALKDWDPDAQRLPGDDAYKAMFEDLVEASEAKTNSRVGTRLNYEQPGVSSLFRGTPRDIAPRGAKKQAELRARIDQEGYRGVLIASDAAWGEPEIWRTLKRFRGAYTSGYFLGAVDARFGADGGVELKPEDQQIYLDLFQRTLFMSLLITFTTLLMGYPIAYLLATLPMRTSNLLLILVLLPFWTSLLVRTSAWIVLLQQQGVVNDLLLFTGLNTPFYYFLGIFGAPNVSSLCDNDIGQLVAQGAPFLEQMAARGADAALSTCAQEVLAIFRGDGAGAALARAAEIKAAGDAGSYGDERFAMIFNQTGTVVAMTHILLPFMIMPLYSVMKTIPPSFVRAAKSLGASNWTAFWRVYFPNTIPGVGAGAILVFILSIGYYITPELVGGTEGTFISNRIAYHISSSLNWGLAAALGTLLLVVVLILFYVYDKIVGVDNVKLG